MRTGDRGRSVVRHVLRVVVALAASAGLWAAPAAGQVTNCESTPPVTAPGETCDDVTPESSTTVPTEQPPTSDASPTTESTTTTEATTTTESTTTLAPTTTAPPTTMPTTAPPEAEPTAPTTTVVVESFTRVTQETPGLSGVVALFVLGLVGAGAVLGVGYVNSRR